MFEADSAATRASRALAGWNVVLMPPVHYGEGGANEMGGILAHPGTYGIRQTTLRSLVADIGTQVAPNGFKGVFVLTGHGPPHHSIAINDACDVVSESFGVTMLHISGLFRADTAIQSRGRQVAVRHFSPADIASLGLDVHAGAAETSPDLDHPALAGPIRKALEKERAFEGRLQEWLDRRRRQ